MKKIIFTSLILGTSIMLAACGDEEKKELSDTVNTPSNVKVDSSEGKEDLTDFGYLNNDPDKEAEEAEQHEELEMDIGQRVEEYELYTTKQEIEIMKNIEFLKSKTNIYYNTDDGYNYVQYFALFKNNSKYDIDFIGADFEFYTGADELEFKNYFESNVADNEFVKSGDTFVIQEERKLKETTKIKDIPMASFKIYTANRTKGYGFDEVKVKNPKIVKENGKYYLTGTFDYKKDNVEYVDIRGTLIDQKENLIMTFSHKINNDELKNGKQNFKYKGYLTKKEYDYFKQGAKLSIKAKIKFK